MKLLRSCCRSSRLLTSELSTSSTGSHNSVVASYQCRQLQTSAAKPATPLAHPLAPGPPPKPPVPQTTSNDERVARKKRNAELLERGRQMKPNPSKPGSALRKRFWKDVHVKESPDGYQVFLDTRPVRTPAKTNLTIPLTKPHLATAIALEWDLLVSTQQALKHHYIPMTSLTSRAMDIATADAQGDNRVRQNIVKMAMDYLTTDTLLCWAPEKNLHDPEEFAKREFIESNSNTGASASLIADPTTPAEETKPGSGIAKLRHRETSLRKQQEAAATPIISFLTTHIWPGVQLDPVLENDSIMPTPQPEETTKVIQGWVSNLAAWDLAGLERACLATKSLCVAARFLVEWSGEHDPRRWLEAEGVQRFGIEHAAEACSQEVKWQTKMWGEVEDTHDVENEDLRRQLGSVILLVNGSAA